MTPAPPAADPKWLPQVRDWWDAFWASELSARLPATSRPALWRLFGWYHRREVFQRRADSRLMVKGSTGQPRVNPLVDQVVAIDHTIEDLEKRLFGPLATASGGGSDDPGAILEAANTRFLELVGEHDVDAADPRAELVDERSA